MAAPGERLDALLRLLRDRPGITAGEAAAAFDVSTRSLFRDIAALRRRGYPVEASRGRGGGLRLHPRWSLSTVHMTPDEALSVLLALAVAQGSAMPILGGEIARARRKIVDAFPAAQRRVIGALRARVFVGAPASPRVRASYGEPLSEAMRHLQLAFVGQRIAVADYQREDGSVAERHLEPHALVINWPAWYLLAHDRDRGASRTFRLDRFRRVTPGTDSFQPRPEHVARTLLEADGVALDPV